MIVQKNNSMSRLLLLALLAGTLLILAHRPVAGQSDETRSPAPQGRVTPNLQRAIPSRYCAAMGSYNCHRGSPALADVDNDGRDDIVIGSSRGHILAIKDNGTAAGQLLFDVDIAPHFGMPANSNVIASSPAVADIDQDGRVEIVVGAGWEASDTTSGGVIVLEHNGAVKYGWPRMSAGTHWNGNTLSIFSSPAVGDLDNDGDMEIVVGGFDKRIYAWHHNGQLLPGFTPDSYLANRFPNWPDLDGVLADSIWGSPALADIDGDGYLDIIIGTDEGNFDDTWGNGNGWSCPYSLPAGWAPGYCGGSLYALDRNGDVLPGFPKYILETIQSTPAIVDLNADQLPDIVVGTGTFYRNFSPDAPTFGYKLHAWDNAGNQISGWGSGKNLGGTSPSAPVVGDIAGDSMPELIIAANDRKLYAFYLNGTPVPGFPMTPKNFYGDTTGFDVGISLILADYDGDEKMEIIFSQNQSVTVINGNGQQLTSVNDGGDGKPVYYANGMLFNTPAIGDIDGDGKLELVAYNSDLYVWPLPAAAGTRVEWGQFKQNAAGTGAYALPGYLAGATGEVTIMHDRSDITDARGAVTIVNGGDRDLFWEVASAPAGLTFANSSGVITGGSSGIPFTIDNTSSYPDGWHTLGNIVITTENDKNEPAGSASVPVTLFIGDVTNVYVPITAGSP